MDLSTGVVGPETCQLTGGGNGLERPAAQGDSPVPPNPEAAIRCLSRAGHVKPCPNPGGPPPKPEHGASTDSEQVPRGKGEKNPERGVKET